MKLQLIIERNKGKKMTHVLMLGKAEMSWLIRNPSFDLISAWFHTRRAMLICTCISELSLRL